MAPRNRGLALLRPDPIGASLALDQASTTRVPPPRGVDSCVLRLRVRVLKVHKRPRLHSKAICAGIDWRAHTHWLDGGDTDLLRRVSQEAMHPAATTSTARRWWPTCNATAASPVTSSVPFMNEDMGMYLDGELIHHYHLDSARKVLCVLENGRGRKLIFVEINFLYSVLLYVSFGSFV
ncbi:uncharacterized protein LOC119320489 [Triticum dicoccoides]|uniref:uncharacterized protein LOC119320489 n=1 Tax=Triticum dicoccoides TaxID=85692 RepID=UPI001891A955|nr:uncharacterized protein LOC119320489 [Triticum dicoccoides]